MISTDRSCVIHVFVRTHYGPLRYFSLYHDRVSTNLALGPKPNGKLLPGGSYKATADGCQLMEAKESSNKRDLQKILGMKKTILMCTHCESRPGHLPRESYLDLNDCPLLVVLLTLIHFCILASAMSMSLASYFSFS